jgi:hypothetical protein
MSSFALVEVILRNHAEFFEEIRRNLALGNKIRSLMFSSFIFLAVYGAVMGASHSLPQALSSLVKLLVLFLVTLVICTPSLHFFNVLFGSRQSIRQKLSLMLTAMSTTAVLLLSFAPVTLYFLLTTSEYQFFQPLNVGFFAIAGYMGIVFLRQGIRKITGDDNPEGAQSRRLVFLVWTLRSFIGMPGEPFVLLNQVGGEFYTDVLTSFSILVGFRVPIP